MRRLKRKGIRHLLKMGFRVTKDFRILCPHEMTTNHLINAVNMLDRCPHWRKGWADRLTEELSRRWRYLK